MRRFTVVVLMLTALGGAAWGQDPEKKPLPPSPPEPVAMPLPPTAAVFEETRTKLAPLGVLGDSIRALGVRPYGICPDGVSALKALASREKIDFPLLADPTREISQLFGMFDDDNQAIQSGLVIVDAQGVIRMLLQGPSLHADDVFQMVKHVVGRV